MQTFKTRFSRLSQSILLATLSLAAAAIVTRAATFTFETKVPGYSSAGWVLVKPELRSQLGGRVTLDPVSGRYVTDRVSRGDQMRMTIVPSTRKERCRNGSLSGLYSASGYFKWAAVKLPCARTFKVTTNPNIDNVYAWTLTSSGYFEKRIPIGTRPK